MRTRPAWKRMRDFRSNSLWLMPAVAVVIALILGLVLSEVDTGEDSALRSLVFQGGAGEARELLTVIAGTMITVTGLVFVLTVIALQIASSQFSPRLLKTFLRDRGTQVVLSTFVATFAYSLAGLHTVGRVSDGEIFVPRLAISGALALALVSVGMLVYYIHHITDSIRIDTIMLAVERGTRETLDRLHPRSHQGAPERITELPAHHLVVGATSSGYVQAYHTFELAAHARTSNVSIAFAHPVGHHVVQGRPVAHVWSATSGASPPEDSWTTRVDDAMSLSAERSIERDIAFGVRQLVDIAIKAVGPSVNDPYTSVQAIQHLSVILVDLVGRDLGPAIDTVGSVQVITPVSSFESYLHLVCSHIRQEAASRPRVVEGLLRLLEDVMASTADPARRACIIDQTRLVMEDARRQIEQQADLTELVRLSDSVLSRGQPGE